MNRAALVALAFVWTGAPTQAQDCCDERIIAIEAQRLHDPKPKPEREPCPRQETDECEEPRVGVRGMVGAVAGASTDTEVEVDPFVTLAVAADLTEWASRGPVFDFELTLTSLPADTHQDFEEPRAFNAVELRTGLCQQLPRPLMFSVCGTFGAASRLSTGSEPASRLPLFWAGEVLFASKDNAHRFTIGIGPDQRLSGGWTATLTVGGRVKLLKFTRRGKRDPGGLFVFGSYLRSLDDGFAGVFLEAPRDALRVGLAVGL